MKPFPWSAGRTGVSREHKILVGADGLIIEVHPCPEEALCDGAQALTPDQFIELTSQVHALHDLITEPISAFADGQAQ